MQPYLQYYYLVGRYTAKAGEISQANRTVSRHCLSGIVWFFQMATFSSSGSLKSLASNGFIHTVNFSMVAAYKIGKWCHYIVCSCRVLTHKSYPKWNFSKSINIHNSSWFFFKFVDMLILLVSLTHFVT